MLDNINAFWFNDSAVFGQQKKGYLFDLWFDSGND